MGAWGVGPLESDEGLDVKERWDDWISGYNAVGYDETIKRFFEHWGDAIRYGDSITNNEVIALVALHFESQREVPKRLVKTAADAINRELEPTELDKWSDSERQARQDLLLGLLEKIGGERKPPKKPHLFLDPALQYRSLDSARSRLLSAYMKAKRSSVPLGLKGAGFPNFILTLSRFMDYGIWEKDAKIYMQARSERLMMLATYLALELSYSEEELKSFLDEVRSRSS